eukprot:5736678-Pleurochrysis_carterae.AAC.1
MLPNLNCNKSSCEMRPRDVSRQNDVKLANAKGPTGGGWANTQNTKPRAVLTREGSMQETQGLDVSRRNMKGRDANVVRRKGRYERSTSHKGSSSKNLKQ